MAEIRYAVRRARSTEPGRWVICRNGFSNDVKATGFVTRFGAERIASRWARQDDKADEIHPVRP